MSIISLDLNLSSYYSREKFKTGLIGTSDCNNYIPLYSLYCHDLLLFKDRKDIKIIEYSFPNYTLPYPEIRVYSQLMQTLQMGTRPVKFNFTTKGESHSFNALPGMLYDDNENILMCLSINSNYVLNGTKEELEKSFDVKQCVLIISDDFINNPIYKNAYKKLKSEYIDILLQEEVDIVITKKSKDWLFRNNYQQPNFKNVIDLMKHLKEEVPKSLLID